jgi:hypothetical protein
VNIVWIVLTIIAGAIAVVLTELFTMAILNFAPLDLDLTSNLFVSVVTPAVLMVHLLLALIFWKAFEPEPMQNSLIFVASHASLQAAELITFNNPSADVAAYVTIIVLSGLAVTWVFRRYFWCAACARIGN